MKFTGFIVALAVAGTATVAIAEAGGRHAGKPIFSELDADANGEVTKEELAAHAQGRFTAMDTNGDGQVSETEMQAHVSERAAKRVERRYKRMLERLDADDDGMLSVTEMRHEKHEERMFAHLDEDGSGAISKAEFEAAKGKHRRHRKPHHESED